MSTSSMRAWEKWTRIIEDQRTRGLTVARFCEARGIPASSFFPWRKRLRDAPAGAAFVEAKMERDGDGREPCGEAGGRGGVTIELAGGRRVIVSRGFDRDLLLDVIGALESGADGRPGVGS
ncbi:MAG: hypothetical protein AB7O77_17315 [Phycisphaerales bacterium]